MSAISKQEVRRNPLAEWLGVAVQFILAHRKEVLAGLVVLGLSIVAGAAYWWYGSRQADAASRALAEAEVVLRGDKPDTSGNADEAIRRYQIVMQQFRGTESAEEALIRLGNLQFDLGRLNEARKAFAEYLRAYPKGRFSIIAALGQAYAAEASGDLQGAVQTLTDVLNRAKSDPLAGEAYVTLARLYESLKKQDDAMRVYGQVVEQFNRTQWAQRALQRMSALKAK